MKNPNINVSRIVSYLALATAAVSLALVFIVNDPGVALGHALNAAAYLLISLYLLFRPDEPVLFLAVFLVGVLSALALAGELRYGLSVGEIRLLELFIALLAVSLAEVLGRRGKRA